MKYWTFSCIGNSASMKSNTVDNAWTGRNVWTVNNGWTVILAYYNFTRLLQKLFNGDKMQDIKNLTPDNVLNSLMYRLDHFSTLSYTRVKYKLSNIVGFYGLN